MSSGIRIAINSNPASSEFIVPYSANVGGTNMFGNDVSSTPIIFGNSEGEAIDIQNSGSFIDGSGANSFFPIKNSWTAPRALTAVSLIVTLGIPSNSTTTLANGNLRVALFISTDTGLTYNRYDNLYVDFTPAQLVSGTSLTLSSFTPQGIAAGSLVALIPTVVPTGLAVPTGDVSYTISASLRCI
jgi:hypothetical protein